ncbi:MAG: biotin/lipoyl-containing protein [Candidatus Zixiibacteriota bacterium]
MSRYQVTIDGRDYDITLEYRSEHYFATVNGRQVEIRRFGLGDNRSLLLIDNESLEVDVHSAGINGLKSVFMGGMEIQTEIEDYHLAQMRKAAGISHGPAVETVLRAPMPGMVVEVKVQPGQTVVKGQALVVIEAMKMENIIKARGEGIVKVVHVAKGKSVERGDALLEFET